MKKKNKIKENNRRQQPDFQVNRNFLLMQLLNYLNIDLRFPTFLNAKLNESKTATQNRLSKLYYKKLVGRYKTRGNRSIYFLTKRGKEVLSKLMKGDSDA